MKKFAFTLAEVLITLGIIAIVAEVTIPSLVGSYQKIIYVTQLKKFYSEFTQGMKTYIASKECYNLHCTKLFDGSSNSDGDWSSKMDAEIANIFKTVKISHNGETTLQNNEKYLKGNGAYSTFATNYNYQTVDGYLVHISDVSADNCTGYDTTTTDSRLKNFCAVVDVDVNGAKLPNKTGRDYFRFFLGNDGNLYPFFGMDEAKAKSNLNEGWQAMTWNSGGGIFCGIAGSSELTPTNVYEEACAARIMDENWEMNY